MNMQQAFKAPEGCNVSQEDIGKLVEAALAGSKEARMVLEGIGIEWEVQATPVKRRARAVAPPPLPVERAEPKPVAKEVEDAEPTQRLAYAPLALSPSMALARALFGVVLVALVVRYFAQAADVLLSVLRKGR